MTEKITEVENAEKVVKKAALKPNKAKVATKNAKDTVNKGSKWGALFLGEKLVDLYIPYDPMNPVKQHWLAVNGQEIWLAVDTMLKVPESIGQLWANSAQAAKEAQKLMSDVKEIN